MRRSSFHRSVLVFVPLALTELAVVASRAQAQPESPQGEQSPGHPPSTGPAPQEPADPGEDMALPPGHPPLGPADVINQAREAAQRAEVPDEATMRRAMGHGPPLAQQRPSPSVPPGVIMVTVVGPDDEPIVGADVDVGVMVQEGDRERHTGRTGPGGVYEFTGLPTGGGQAYRVNVNYQGAKYSGEPFRLPPDMGYDVRIRRLPTTRDSSVVMQYMGEVRFEFGEGRLKVIQIAVLLNASAETYVFPEDGQEVVLPEGFLSFHAQDVMSDQRFEPTERGFRLRGSLPPGQQQLVWTYDLDLSGSNMTISVPLPWRTMMYGVVAEAAEGMDLSVDGMPPPQLDHMGDARVLMTRLERRPGDPPLDRIQVHLRNLPGPGPLRFIAFGAMLLLLATGMLFLMRGGDPIASRARAREIRRQELLDRAASLQRSLASDEIGPKYHARQMDEIIGELAILLRQETADRRPSQRKARRA